MPLLPGWVGLSVGCGLVGVAAAAWVLSRWRLVGRNYRGVDVARPYGIAALVAQFLALLLASSSSLASVDLVALTFACTVMGLTGLADDFSHDPGSGFRYHLATAWRQGRATSGLVKLIVGGSGCFMATWLRGSEGWTWIADGALIAVWANLLNLLDRAPGRALKVGALLLLASSPFGHLAVVGLPVVVALAIFAPRDLREAAMMGDTGSNLLGLVVAFGWLGASITAKGALLGLGLVLTVFLEFISLSAVVERSPLLGRLDSLGRSPQP